MAHGFTESSDGLRYEERISVPMRLFVGAIGLGMFAIPVPFLMHAHPGMPLWHLLLAALCVVLPGLVGLLFLAIALGRCLRLHFDTPRRRLLRTSRWPLGARDAPSDYAHIAPPELRVRTSEDGPYYVVQLTLHGERPMQLGAFDQREDAELWRGRIATQLRGG